MLTARPLLPRSRSRSPPPGRRTCDDDMLLANALFCVEPLDVEGGVTL